MIRSFNVTDTQTPWIYMPSPAEVFADATAIPDNLLRPLLRADGAMVDPRLDGLPLAIVAHEVGIDDLVFRIDEAGRYILETYGPRELDPDAPLRDQLEAYIDEVHGCPEDLEDENAELFDDDETRAYLETNDESTNTSSDVELHTGDAKWIQNTSRGPISDDPEFVFALLRHPILFGAYYLFVDVEKRRVRQVFQCT